MLCISAAIGIYYRFSGGHQKTMEEYFIANRSMSILPVAIAMMASHLSALAFLGISAENYIYGTQIIGINLGYFLSIPILCYGFIPVFFKLQVTSIYETFYTISGIIGGPLLGIFTLGMGTESATEGGAITGALITFSFLLWIVFGQPRPIPPKLPTTIKGCNNVNMTMSDLQLSFFKRIDDSSYFYLYRISYMWYSPIGLLMTFILGLLVSNLSRLFIKNQNDELNTNLFFPMIARRIRHRRHNNKKNKENPLLNRRYSHSDEKDDTDKIYTKL
ncbi:Putative sodium-dependent multivitamin transporter [Acromyrmex echinatior]|uniref:Putative sodium-dependent multivitamin transporter n=1 Tax=Acromyrmex echinatior TaxID=103372 RepID=F4W7J7_ACREC|nr:Putative sodium-dependent multivitamin transporter [Acromyrmex echinatior]